MSDNEPSLLITILGPIGISSLPEEYQCHLHGFLDGLQDISNFMGHKLTEKGVESDQSKVEAIKEMPRPVDKAALQRCLSMQILSESVRNRPTPQRFNKAGRSVVFSDGHENAFSSARELITSGTILH